jgi:hypothetical protein
MNRSTKLLTYGSAIILSLIVFPGCQFLKKKTGGVGEVKGEEKKEDGVVLFSVNSKPVIRESDFNERLREALDMSPFSRGAPLDIVPVTEKRRFFDILINEELLLLDADKKNVESDSEFIKAYDKIKNLIKRNMKVQRMKTKIFEAIKVDADEVTKFYNENKKHFVKVEGGTLVSGIKFSTDVLANAFLAKTKAKIDGFEKLAKANKNGQYSEFGRISKDSEKYTLPVVPAPVKESVLAMVKFPSVEKVKVGKDIWIIKGSDPKETVYKDMAEVKTQIEGAVKSKKLEDEVQKRIKELKSEYTIAVNDSYFKAKEAEKAAEEKKVEEKKGEEKESTKAPESVEAKAQPAQSEKASA